MRETLPGNWIETNLSNVVIYGKGKKPKKLSTAHGKDMVPYINIKAFEQGIIDEFADMPSSKLIDREDILVVWDGARFGLTGMGIEGAAGSTLMVLKPVLCYPKYIYSFINRYYSYINSKPKGTGTPHVNPDIFWNLQFPIAPLNEQNRIVARLDAIIPRIDSLKARLDKIPTLIERFRQSVLTAAVTGKLTEKWREEHPEVESAEVLLERIKKERENRYKKACEVAKKKGEHKPKKIHLFNNNETELPFDAPISWKNTTLGNIIYDFCYGSSEKSDYNKKGTPVVRIPNVLKKYLDLTDLKYLEHEEKNNNNIVTENDVLIIRSNGSKALVGKNCIVPFLEKEYAFASYLIRIRPAIINANYMYIILNAPVIKEQFYSTSKSSAGINNINTEELSNVTLALPPFDEQKEIVRQVENLFAFADKLEAHFQKAKARIDKLSQSVLAKAFRGELVPQDPNDEPAEKLLERIMAEKTKMESALKGVKKKGAGQKAKAGSRK
ncbi:MAG: restriction endonuclease subunit S [Pseudomonadota bacterium]